MMGGLPGGSPGPNAEGTWKGLLFVFLLCLAGGAGILYAFQYLADMQGGLYGMP